MRKTCFLVTAALVLLPVSGLAQAPQAPQTQAQAPAAGATLPFTGMVDFGGLFTNVDGDEARYQRYRDDRDGVFTGLTLNRQTDAFLFDANARHIGYRDQRYDLTYRRSKLNFGFGFAGQPLNYSYIVRTPFDTNGSILTLSDAAQRAVQGPSLTSNTDGSAVGVPCAPGAAAGATCSNPTQAQTALAQGSVYNSLANRFDMRQQRNTAEFGATYSATRDVDVQLGFSSSGRKGEQPWGASFAFNNANELPKPLDDRTNNFSLGTEWAKPGRMVRVSYDGSWFSNNFDSLTWDNPLFIQDYTNNLVPPSGPYDPSGYSNGNGPATGRQSVAPDNSSHVLGVSGLYKVFPRSTINGVAQLTMQKQNDRLIPWTTNSVINSPIVIGAFPHLAALPRETAEAEARGINTMLNFTTRPWKPVNFNVRYRYNQRDVQTTIFDATEYVRFDAVPEEIEEGHTPQFDNTRQIFDANIAYTPSHLGTIRLGYGHEGVTREGRGFADVGEHIFRVSWDTYSSQWVTVRASFDAGRRRGEGLVEASSGGDDLGEPATGPGGTQPTLRYYDEADRDRRRGMVVFTVMPTDKVSVFTQFTGGRDKYLPDDTPVSRPGELFGLHEATTSGFSVGLDYVPSDRVAAGGSWGHDGYGSFQKSRNANPPPDPAGPDVDGSEPRLDTRQRRQHRQREPVSRPAAGVPRYRPPFRVRLQQLGQLVRARRPAHHGAGVARTVHPVAGRGEHVASVQRRRQVLLHATRRRWRRLLLREARCGRLQHGRHQRSGGLRRSDRRSAHHLARWSHHRLRQPSVYRQHRHGAVAVHLLREES
jgi:hypothetical protein